MGYGGPGAVRDPDPVSQRGSALLLELPFFLSLLALLTPLFVLETAL